MRFRGWKKAIAIYLVGLPLIAFAIVICQNSLRPWWQDRPAVGTLTHATIELDQNRMERRLVLTTGAGPWVGADAARPYIPRNVMPDDLIRALLHQEDQAFYSHAGFSPRELYIVLRDYLLYGHRLRGASTVTQQLARTIFLNSERSFRRKVLEFHLARLLETRLQKDEILELYLNHVYWGGESRGVALAARAYHRRPLNPDSDPLAGLGPRDFAFLVALLPNPNACAPAVQPGGDHCRNPGVRRRMTRIIKHLEARTD